MKKKRIAIINPTFGSVERGAETFVREFSNYMQQYYDIDVFSIKKDEKFCCNSISVDCKKSKFLILWEKIYKKSSFIRYILNRTRYTCGLLPGALFDYAFTKVVVEKHLPLKHYDLLFPQNGFNAVKLCCKYGKEHNLPVVKRGGGGVGPDNYYSMKQNPDVWVAITSMQKEWAQRFFKNVELIYNGVFTNKFTTKIDKLSFYINKNHKLVVCVGHLDMDFKRMHLALLAISKLSNVDLLILGRGEKEDELNSLAERLMPGRYKIMGVPYEEVPFYYQSADLFTLPSINEPFGIVYIEAMASGLPVVATDDLARREIIGKAGLVCNVENSDEYAQTIKKALDTNYGDIPQKQAALFDWSVIGEKYHNLFENLMQKRNFSL